MSQFRSTAMLVHYPAPRNGALEIIINNQMYSSVKDVKNTFTVDFHGVAGIGTSEEDATQFVLLYAISDPYDNRYPTTEELEAITASVKKIDAAIAEVSFQNVPTEEEVTFKLN